MSVTATLFGPKFVHLCTVLAKCDLYGLLCVCVSGFVVFFCPLTRVSVPPSPLSGRLLDATKKYMFVFLLAGCEVVVSALVLATCNFLCIGKSPTPPDKFESITMTDDAKMEGISHPVEVEDEERGGSKPEPEKEAEKDVAEEEKGERVKPESAKSQEVDGFLTEAQQNGGVGPGPETSM